jgi:hypothetical protein
MITPMVHHTLIAKRRMAKKKNAKENEKIPMGKRWLDGAFIIFCLKRAVRAFLIKNEIIPRSQLLIK